MDKLAVSKEQRLQELQLWYKWKEGGEKPEDLEPLLHSMRPLIRHRANRYVVGNLDTPPAAVHAEFNKQFLNAAHTYNPEKGTSLHTWVSTNLRKAERWAASYRNPARIVESRFYKVGEFRGAKATLDQEFGREPTADEVADYLKWPVAEVTRMESEDKAQGMRIGSMWQDDPATMAPSPELEKLRMVRYELSPEELRVYEYLLGFGGKPQLQPLQVAKKLGIHPSKVTRIKASIAKKLERYA